MALYSRVVEAQVQCLLSAVLWRQQTVSRWAEKKNEPIAAASPRFGSMSPSIYLWPKGDGSLIEKTRRLLIRYAQLIKMKPGGLHALWGEEIL